jgi:cbb3-type cytochrome oxidase subunit 3
MPATASLPVGRSGKGQRVIDPDRIRAEVPTLRTDTRTQRVLLAFLVPDLVLNGLRLPLPVRIGLWALAAAFLVVTVWAYRRTSRGRPPVRATAVGLQLPDDEGNTVAIAWSDIAGFRFTRRCLLPQLLVEPVGPDRVRPSPNPWQRAAATQRDGYRLRVSLGGDRAARAGLRAEMASHAPAGPPHRQSDSGASH